MKTLCVPAQLPTNSSTSARSALKYETNTFLRTATTTPGGGGTLNRLILESHYKLREQCARLSESIVLETGERKPSPGSHIRGPADDYVAVDISLSLQLSLRETPSASIFA